MSFYNVNIFASFNPESLVDPQGELTNYGNPSVHLNTVPANQTCSISAHEISNITNLVITSNGINDGNFNIFPIHYVNEPVQFVAQLIDLSGFEVRDYALLPQNCFKFCLSASDGSLLTNAVFVSSFGSLSALNQGGFFKGYFVSPITASNVCIKAVYTDVNLDLTGTSSTFSIYSSGGVYQLRKINENFDQAAAFKSLAIQPVLYDKTMFLDSFLGQIVGNSNSDPNTLGIEVYEKISNYISNVDDIDYCNLNQLKSLLDNINVTYENFNYQYPPSFRRLTDMLSVKHKKLFGQLNQYEGNFNSKGFINSPKYGLNKGDELDIYTAVLTAGQNITPNVIVILEKFSQNYSVANTNLINLNNYITVTPTTSTYALSSCDSTWGWNLVLPPSVSGVEISKYYQFFKFKPGIEGSLLQKFIDFDNPNNTLYITNSSYQNYVSEGGIMDNILLYNLYTGLEVLS